MTSAQLAETLNLDDTLPSSQQVEGGRTGLTSLHSSQVGSYKALGLAPGGGKTRTWQPVLRDKCVSRKSKPRQRPLGRNMPINNTNAHDTTQHMMSQVTQDPHFPGGGNETQIHERGQMLNIIPAGMYVR